MRGKLVAMVVVAALVATIGASVTSASPAITTAHTIKLVQGPPEQQYVDLGDAGPSPGDILVFKSDLFDASGSTKVGDLHIQCVQNFDSRFVCVGIFALGGRGQISVDAEPVFPNPVIGVVTGGSGAFQNVRGEVHIDPQTAGTTKLTFRLIP